MINTRPELFQFKQDILTHFATFDLPLQTLASYPGLFSENPKSVPISALYLIDHNELPPSQEHLAPRVRGVIDHHMDTGLFRPKCPSLYIVEKCGSAMTLVVEAFQSEIQATWDHELCWFALAPIYSDSKIFNKKLYQVKWVDKDLETKNFLKNFAKQSMKMHKLGSNVDPFGPIDHFEHN